VRLTLKLGHIKLGVEIFIVSKPSLILSTIAVIGIVKVCCPAAKVMVLAGDT